MQLAIVHVGRGVRERYGYGYGYRLRERMSVSVNCWHGGGGECLCSERLLEL